MSDITTAAPEINPLMLPLFDNTTLASLFKEVLEGVDVVQSRTLDVIRDLQKMLTDNPQDKPMVELMMLIAPILKDYLSEYSSQTESKLKVATAIATIVKAQQQVALISQNFGEPSTPLKGTSLLEKLQTVDPLAASFAKEKTNSPLTQAVSTMPESKHSADDEIHVIHSPDYREPK